MRRTSVQPAGGVLVAVVEDTAICAIMTSLSTTPAGLETVRLVLPDMVAEAEPRTDMGRRNMTIAPVNCLGTLLGEGLSAMEERLRLSLQGVRRQLTVSAP